MVYISLTKPIGFETLNQTCRFERWTCGPCDRHYLYILGQRKEKAASHKTSVFQTAWWAAFIRGNEITARHRVQNLLGRRTAASHKEF
jgi:hypothetical protein